MADTFRRVYLSMLWDAWQEGRLRLGADTGPYGNEAALLELCHTLEQRRWVAWCEAPIKGAAQVYQYLSRYVHRPAMSNGRIQKIEGQHVHFEYKDYQDEEAPGQPKVKPMSLEALEFIRRFMQHVLPRGFQRIRYYGLMSGACRHNKYKKALALLQPHTVQHRMRTVCQIVAAMLGRDIDECEHCGARQLHCRPLPSNPGWLTRHVTWDRQRGPPVGLLRKAK